MDYLEGVLAFAVVMILLATLASGIVEVLVRISALRALVLARMIEHFAHVELPKRVGKKLGKAIDGLVDDLTRSPLAQESGWLDWLANKAGELKILRSDRSAAWRANLKRVDSLTVWAFLQRLARTPYGEEILRQGEERALEILTDVTRTYERYAAASRELFRRRANTVALVGGIFMGPILNVNAPVLLDYLVANAAARDALVAQIEPARAAYAAQQARTEAALAPRAESTPAPEGQAGAEDGATPEPGTQGSDAQQPEPDASAASSDATESATNAEEQDLDEAFENLQRNYAKLAALDLPILFDVYPSAGERRGTGGFLLWLLGALLGGFLIGLGGPFWFRVVDSLTQVVQLLRGLSGKPRESSVDPEAEKSVITGDLEKALGTEKMVELFRIAAGLPKGTGAGTSGAPEG